MTDWDWPNSTVTRIVDGDSLVARVTRDLGFNGEASYTQKLRLNRINALPARTNDGRHATEMVRSLTSGVSLHIVTVGPYKYRDEWMAEIILPDGRNLSDVLVDAHLAVYWDGHGPRPGG
jgi:endonuclease YncB( thermonuclease family)